MHVAIMDDREDMAEYWNTNIEAIRAIWPDSHPVDAQHFTPYIAITGVAIIDTAGIMCARFTPEPEGSAAHILMWWFGSIAKMKEGFIALAEETINQGRVVVCGFVKPGTAGSVWLDSYSIPYTEVVGGIYAGTRRYCMPAVALLERLQGG